MLSAATRGALLFIALAWCVAYATADDSKSESEASGAKVATGEIRRGEQGFRALYTMDRDGEHIEFLTAGPGMISSSSPMWSHSGKYVAYDACAALDHVDECKIFVYAVDGPFRGQTMDLGFGNAPKWSPDDTQIVFGVNSGNPVDAKDGVWLMNADGTNRRWIADGFFARFSPDGKSLCYEGAGGLSIYDIASGTSRSLLPENWTLGYASGTWSPDGRRVMFVGVFEGRPRLASIDANGDADSIQIIYTQREPGQRMIGPPAWSPDGRQAALSIQDNKPGVSRWSNSHVYSLAVDVPSAPVLMGREKIGDINRAPDWHPDGKILVFSSQR